MKKPAEGRSERRVVPRIRVFRGKAIALGPGKADLLEAVGRTGAIAEAARSLSMSYRRAWSLIQTMNAEFRSPLVIKKVGGAGGGGAELTDDGRRALELYRSMERKARRAIERDAAKLEDLLRD